MFLSIKIVWLHRQEHGCSRRNASNSGIEIESIPAFQCNVIVSYCEPGLALTFPGMVLDVFWLNAAIFFSRPDLIPQLGSALDIIFAYSTGLLII